MNKEDMECKVIASLMIMLDDKFSNEAKRKAMKDVKKIFDKQQKEIEEKTTILMANTRKLKELNIDFDTLVAEFERLEDLEDRIVCTYVSKDKIRKLIKEKAKTDTYNFKTIAVKDIEELLGEKTNE